MGAGVSSGSIASNGTPQAASDREREWLERDNERWRRAHAIAASHPGMDVSGVYHVLRNLEKTPTERLRDALRHGRLFSPHGR
jgi:hypothetical protein